MTANENYCLEPIRPASRNILNEWAALWEDGKFAGRTEAGQPKEYAFRVQPIRRHKDKPPLEFGIFEISGVDLQNLIEADGTPKPALMEELASLLKDPEINFVLVFVCNGGEPNGENPDSAKQDEFFSSFMAYLKDNYGNSFAARCPILLLLSKPQEALVEGSDGEEGMIEPFVTSYLPATFDAVQTWQAGYALAKLDVGPIEYAGNGEPLLYSPKFEDAARVFRWAYLHLTRYALSDPFLSRLWRTVRKSVS